MNKNFEDTTEIELEEFCFKKIMEIEIFHHDGSNDILKIVLLVDKHNSSNFFFMLMDSLTIKMLHESELRDYFGQFSKELLIEAEKFIGKY